jgi:hypothetical protein
MPRRRPQPVAASIVVSGRPAEVTELANELMARLNLEGWNVEDESRGKSPRRAARLLAGEQWLAVAVGAPSPHCLTLGSSYEISASGVAFDCGRLHDLFAEIPFTKLELERLAHDMPLTASVGERAATWVPSLKLGERPLDGLGGIFTIHHQTDFVLLLEKALELGVRRDLITVIDKEYRYQHSRRVDAHIRQRLRIPVYRYSKLDDGLSDHFRRVVAAGDDPRTGTWTKTIIVDDGGYVLPRLHESYEPFLSFLLGAVEQTRSGIWKLEPFAGNAKVPIFSVAESELKATVEAHGVAQAAVACLRRALPHEKLDGRRAVVVGYGTIGAALADLLRRQRVDVSVVDSNPSPLVAAREFGFNVGDDLADLIPRVAPRYIFACGGPDPIGADALAAIKSDCVLTSLTSRDVAFDKAALDKIAPGRKVGTVGTVYSRDPGCNLLLLADGFPINFHFSESMPNQQSDLVMASLLAGALTLAKAAIPWGPGNDPARANAALNEGALLHDFLTAEPSLTMG